MDDLQKALDALILKGKRTGQLSSDDILEGFSNLHVDPDTFDRILERFVNEGIEVVDDADEEEFAGENVSPGELVSIQFDASARELIRWATWIALHQNAQEVGTEHLLAAVQAESRPPEPVTVWDIPFSSRVQSGLAQCCVGRTEVTRRDILDEFVLW